MTIAFGTGLRLFPRLPPHSGLGVRLEDAGDSRLCAKYSTSLYYSTAPSGRASLLRRCWIANHGARKKRNPFAAGLLVLWLPSAVPSGIPVGSASLAFWVVNSVSPCRSAPEMSSHPVGCHDTALPRPIGSNVRCENRVWFVYGKVGSVFELGTRGLAAYVADTLPDFQSYRVKQTHLLCGTSYSVDRRFRGGM